MYIFYDPKDLKIMAGSTEKNALEYPYIKIKEDLHTLDSIVLKREGKKVVHEINNEITLEARIKRDQNYQIK